MTTAYDITPDEPWACKFKIQTLVDSTGAPVDTRNLQPGDSVNGSPGEYTSIGVIAVRDTTNRKLKVVDIETHREYTVDFDSVWDIDRVEWTDNTTTD